MGVMACGGCRCFFFFFAAIWVDLMVVVGCGLRAMTVPVVVCQWWWAMGVIAGGGCRCR